MTDASLPNLNQTGSADWADVEGNDTALRDFLNNTGVHVYQAGSIVNTAISGSAAIAHSKLANLAAGKIILGNASNVPTDTTLTGDVTVTSSGVTAIGNGKVTTGMLASGITVPDDSITAAKIAADAVGSSEIAANAVGASEIGSLPGCRLTKSASQSIAASTLAAVTFDGEAFDTDTMHDNSSNTSRITATTAGVYTIGGFVFWQADNTSTRFVGIRLNGTTTHIVVEGHPTSVAAGTVTYQAIQTIYKLAAADYVELTVYQASSSALNVYGSGSFGGDNNPLPNSATSFYAHYLGDG